MKTIKDSELAYIEAGTVIGSICAGVETVGFGALLLGAALGPVGTVIVGGCSVYTIYSFWSS